MDLFDLHCDTPLELLRGDNVFSSGGCHITRDKLTGIGKYGQLAAFCVPQNMSDGDGYRYFFEVAENFRRAAGECGFDLFPDGGIGEKQFILTVEDLRIIENDLSRIGGLYRAGVRLVTPLWGGRTQIGGSHESDAGLTDFGREAVREAIRLGMVPDVSHASPRSADDILSLAAEAGVPAVASHSNSREICDHTRNLTDAQTRAVAASGGIVGVSLYPPHLVADPSAGCTSEDVCRHIMHYIDVIGEDSVCLGCDFDGIGTTPSDLPDVSALPRLRDALLSHGLTEKTVQKIFYENAAGFFTSRLAPERK
jgi:membrane dipeptidase